MGARELIQAIAVTAELTSTVMSDAAVAVMAEDLLAYPEAAVLSALSRCRRELTGRLSLAAVLERLEEGDGRPSSDEAWAIAIAAADEAETVVWTMEMAHAFGIAKPILDARDKVGARMAFREAYDRLVREARAAKTPCGWSVSLGSDTQRRSVAITAAADAGRLTQQSAQALLPPSEATGVVVALLSGDAKALAAYAGDETARRRIEMAHAELRRLDAEKARREEEAAAKRRADEEDFQRRKHIWLEAIAMLRAERGEDADSDDQKAG